MLRVAEGIPLHQTGGDGDGRGGLLARQQTVPVTVELFRPRRFALDQLQKFSQKLPAEIVHHIRVVDEAEKQPAIPKEF